MPDPTPPQIFLCHASEDKAQVWEVYSRLKERGLKPWIAQEDILPGQQWEAEIPQAIKASDFVLIFFSRISVAKRGFVQKEFKLALDVLDEMPAGTIHTIPIRLDDCQIPFAFTGLQYANLFEENGFEKIVRAIQAGTHTPLSNCHLNNKNFHQAARRNLHLSNST